MDFLTYEEARDTIEDGDIIFFASPMTPLNPIQCLIILITGSPLTHCNIAFWATIGGQRRLLGVEAQGFSNRRIINESFYSGRKLLVVKAPKPWSGMADDALAKIAIKDYGYFTAMYAGLRDAFAHWFGVRLPAFKNPGEICSEFVAREIGLDDTDISPGNLYKTLTRK